MNRFMNGAWSGVIATGPMTLALFALRERLPRADQIPLPPAILSDDIGRKIGFEQALSHEGRANVMLLSHFAYGALTGALYSAVHVDSKKTTLPELDELSSIVHGSLYGAAVWALSYGGWIPAFGFNPKVHNISRPRNFMMLAAHVVWGATLAYSIEQLEKRRDLVDGALTSSR